MKGMIGLGLALTFTLSTAPAIAEDAFHAFSTLPAAARASLTPLDDNQLAAVEGENLENLPALVQQLVGTPTDQAEMLIRQILFLVQGQLKTEAAMAVQRNVKEVIQQQLNTESTAAVQHNIVKITQRHASTVSFTRESMW
jgi:hypothetical protein